MTSTVYLVRHGAHSLLDRVLCGRMPGVGLSAEGHAQAKRLATYFSDQPVDLVQSSPQQRARETAMPIAERLRLPLEIAPAMDELDAGEWTGRRFDELNEDERWHVWNGQRGVSRPPGGESMRELQARVVAHLESLRTAGFRSTVIVTHAEPIRVAILHYRGIPLDDFASIPIDPASITTLVFDGQETDASAINIAVPA